MSGGHETVIPFGGLLTAALHYLRNSRGVYSQENSSA